MDGDDEDKALIWKLPVIKSKDLGKLGPAFGYGVGCGFGLGVGLLGGKTQLKPIHSFILLLVFHPKF